MSSLIQYKSLGILLFFLLMTGCDRIEKSQILVKLDKQNITLTDFNEKLNEYQLKLDVLGQKEKEELKKILIHELIEERALMLEAEKRGIKVSREDIRQEKQNNTILSEKDQLEEEIHLSQGQIDQKIKEYLLLEKVQQDITKKVTAVSEAELKLFYQKNKNKFERKRQYMLEMLETKYQKEAESAFKKLGEEGFKSMQINMDILDIRYIPAKWYEKDLLPEVIVHYLRDAKLNSISSILKSPHGYHIVRLNKVRAAYIPDFESVKDEIRLLLLEKKKEKVLLEWKQDFFSQTKIERNYELIEKI